MTNNPRYLVIGLVLASLCGLSAANLAVLEPNGIAYYGSHFHYGWQAYGCTSGTSEYQCVDEGDPPDTGDYAYAYANFSNQVYNFENLPETAHSVVSVTVYYYGSSKVTYVPEPGGAYRRYLSCNFYPLIHSDAVDYLDTANMISMGSTYDYYSVTYSQNPVTDAAWTVSEVNGLRAGMSEEHPDLIFPGGKVAEVHLVVDYTTNI